MLLGVDVGGTFTDAAAVCADGIATAKVPTTPDDQSRGVLAAVAAVLAAAGRDAGAVRGFAHGMTVATNALLEGTVARTALVATEGFTDLIELGRQARADLYRLCAAHPAPLVPAARRFAAPERMTPDGPLRALEPRAARELCARVAEVEPEAVAVVLLHAYRHPEHEQALGAALREALGDVHVSLSHELVGTFREVERAATTEVDAALSPLLARYLRQLAEGARAAGLPEPAIMQSNGGLTDVARAAGHAALTVLSGPAGGAAGAAAAARAAGVRDALCFDMGGTSCDVCLIEDGRVAETTEREIAGRHLALPMLDIHTVGAGGGSIAWRDAGGALRVGPRSAGADPGPACYGRGGREPTVTDASLLLGHLDPAGELAGGVRLDRAAAEQAVGALARELGGLDPIACAEGIVRVACAEMARALRVVSVERGIDPRELALLPFGGAGPMHATAVADELGMDRIVCPRASGVLSALGLVVSERRRDAQRSVLRSGDALTAAALRADVAALAAEARAGLGAAARAESGPPAPCAPGDAPSAAPVARDAVADAPLRCRFDLRYRGQSFELTVEAGADATPGELREAFEAGHERRFGFRDADGEVELVTVRVSAVLPGPDVALEAPRGDPRRARRPAVFGGRTVTAEVLRGELPAGLRIAGPAICEGPETTLVIPPGWRAAVDASGAVELRRGDAEHAP